LKNISIIPSLNKNQVIVKIFERSIGANTNCAQKTRVKKHPNINALTPKPIERPS
jgi:hypothetical protein